MDRNGLHRYRVYDGSRVPSGGRYIYLFSLMARNGPDALLRARDRDPKRCGHLLRDRLLAARSVRYENRVRFRLDEMPTLPEVK